MHRDNVGGTPRLTIQRATDADRAEIERLRHEIYAVELRHYPVEPDGLLREQDWPDRVYLLARANAELAGFVAITPPWAPRYAIERYLSASEAAMVGGPDAFEVRALTVDPRWRNGFTAAALMYAALRWIAGHGGRSLLGMGRCDLQAAYQRLGLVLRGNGFGAGKQRYRVMYAAVADVKRHALAHLTGTLAAIADRVDWRLDVPMALGEASVHGGRSFDAIGAGFDTLSRRADSPSRHSCSAPARRISSTARCPRSSTVDRACLDRAALAAVLDEAPGNTWIWGVRALRDPDHYRACWRQTAHLRGQLATELAQLPDVRVWESAANFLLVRLAEVAAAPTVVRRCQADAVYLRDLSPLSADLQGRYLRVAVREPGANERIVAALHAALR